MSKDEENKLLMLGGILFDPDGRIRCARCECQDIRVLKSRRGPDNTIVRNRECRHCGTRFRTYERVATE